MIADDASGRDVAPERCARVTTEQARRLAREGFGLEATVVDLPGERDCNFLLTGSGRRWVLKVVDPAEASATTDLQEAVLAHLAARDPSLPVPRVRRPVHPAPLLWRGEDGTEVARRVRVYSYLDGELLGRRPVGPLLRADLGATLARTSLALSVMEPGVHEPQVEWDLRRVGEVSALLHEVDHGQVALPVVDHITSHLREVAADLPSQLIHNDFNPQNILVGPTPSGADGVTGVIDFGDLVHASVVQDLAVAAAYQLSTSGHPLDGAVDVVAGFHGRRPLHQVEHAVLYDLILARLVLIVALAGRRARHHPRDREYLLRNHAFAVDALRSLGEVPCSEGAEYLARAVRRLT